VAYDKNGMKNKKGVVESLLDGTGITINGNNPWDPQIHNENFYGRVLSHGSLGLGESYMDGWWNCKALDQFFEKIFTSGIDAKVTHSFRTMIMLALNFALNTGRRSKAFEIGKKHYDVGNDLYRAMLDKRLTYTCGYWKDAKNLDEAQEAKLDLVCQKLSLKGGERLLDIGCGWGSFAIFAAQRYGACVTGVTVSKEQVALAEERAGNLPVAFRFQDYRDIRDGPYDHVVSLGMFEHVGYKNYRTFMRLVDSVLKPDGLFLLHTIGGNRSVRTTDPWIHKYIFPNGMLPSIRQIGNAIENIFVMEDWHNFSTDYDKTLMAWFKNFEKAWPALKDMYAQRFYRMWKYYLLMCAGTFRARENQLWQIVLSKKGVPGGYKSIR
jgi:cyclopropane-fatty-acyl-phospholipid synthase